MLLAAAAERRRASGLVPSSEEIRAAERIEARRRAAGAPEPRPPADGGPTVLEVLGLSLWLEPTGDELVGPGGPHTACAPSG